MQLSHSGPIAPVHPIERPPLDAPTHLPMAQITPLPARNALLYGAFNSMMDLPTKTINATQRR